MDQQNIGIIWEPCHDITFTSLPYSVRIYMASTIRLHPPGVSELVFWLELMISVGGTLGYRLFQYCQVVSKQVEAEDIAKTHIKTEIVTQKCYHYHLS